MMPTGSEDDDEVKVKCMMDQEERSMLGISWRREYLSIHHRQVCAGDKMC